MSHIFISYSHKDSVYVHKLAETLEKEGFAVWIDDRIDYGSEWPKVVTKNLDISNGVIVVLSNNSYESDMVQNEVARAREKKKHIFPLLLEGENWLIVQAKQFVDARDGSFPTEKFYKRLEEVSPRRKTIPPKNEATEKIALEKTERENAEKAAREKAERAAAEKLALENAEREKAEKAAREKADREAKRKITRESKPAPVNLRLLGIGGIILFVCILGGFGLNYLINLPVATATTFSPAPTKTSEVSQTSEVLPTETPTQTPIPIPTLALGIGSTEISLKDNMILLYVPAGEFKMGSTDADSLAQSDEKPQHTVYLDAFWIDRTEVTNKQYAACVSGGVCTPPSNTSSYTRSSYYGNSEFDEFPVIYVDWNQAKAYCAYAGRELPTEAQWEKAASGPSTSSGDARIYPWGNDAPNDTLLNYNQNVGDTTKVGSYKTGKSFYGAYDMAGNVWEWVNDWYSDTYYKNSPSSNPLRPDSGDYRVLRGGSWYYYDNNVRSASRYWNLRTRSVNSDGFRCSRGTSP